MTTVYESPSGSPVVIPEPTPPEPVGILRRKVATVALPSADIDINVAEQVELILLEMTAPAADRYYSVECNFDTVFQVLGLVNNGETIDCRFDASIDNGPWTTVSTSQPSVFGAPNIPNKKHAMFLMPPTLGSALGVVNGTTSLRLRATARGANGPSGDWSLQIQPQGGSNGVLTLEMIEQTSN